jgi:hypothetical protein
MIRKNMLVKFINYDSSGRIAGLAILAAYFLMGMNINRLVLPEAVLAILIICLTTLGVIAYTAKIYWTFYFWRQFNFMQKTGNILALIFLTFLLIIITYIIYRVINVSLS